jgi:hypothetical protein
MAAQSAALRPTGLIQDSAPYELGITPLAHGCATTGCPSRVDLWCGSFPGGLAFQREGSCAAQQNKFEPLHTEAAIWGEDEEEERNEKED